MSLTKAAARTEIREMLDDASAKRWSDARLDGLIARVMDDMWGELLETNPWLTAQVHNLPPLTAPGFLDLRLTTNGGQLTQRFFRVQRVIRESRDYVDIHEHTLKHGVIIENDVQQSAPPLTYQVEGNKLWLFPLQLTPSITFQYSFLPIPFTSLTEGYEVPWPEGYDSSYIFECAARALVKGDAEDMRQMKALAIEAFDKLKNAVSRNMVNTERMQLNDGIFTWG